MADDMKVDITGLMAQPVPDWQERVSTLAKPDFFEVHVIGKKELMDGLTGEEKARLFPKLAMVMNAARYMAAGMVKGTLKYKTDNYDLEQWVAHLVGEGSDQMNYNLLLADAAWRLLAERREERVGEKATPVVPAPVDSGAVCGDDPFLAEFKPGGSE